MQHTLEQFFRALRAADVRVSPAEAIDASRAVTVTGYGDRTLFKDALCATLAKSADEVERFDAVFDTFFARDVATLPPISGADSCTLPISCLPKAAGKYAATLLLRAAVCA